MSRIVICTKLFNGITIPDLSEIISESEEVFPVYTDPSIELIIDDIKNLVFNNKELFTKNKQIISLIDNARRINGVEYNKEESNKSTYLSIISDDLMIDYRVWFNTDDFSVVMTVVFVFNDLAVLYDADETCYLKYDKRFEFYKINDSSKGLIRQIAKNKKHDFTTILDPESDNCTRGNIYKKSHGFIKIKSAG